MGLRFTLLVICLIFISACGSNDGERTLLNQSQSSTSTNVAPKVTDVRIKNSEDNPLVGNRLTASYFYSDADGDEEGNTRFQWLRDGRIIFEATSRSYVLLPEDSNRIITLEITPVATMGTEIGRSVISNSLLVINSAPSVSNVSIVDNNGGSALVGDVLTGHYTFSDIDGNPEGTTTFRWLRNGVAIVDAIHVTYILVALDSGYSVSFEVTPKSIAGIEKGNKKASLSLNINTYKPLNDTGITRCARVIYTEVVDRRFFSPPPHNIPGADNLDCSRTGVSQVNDGVDDYGNVVRGGQDAMYGRDATHSDNSDGRAGFSYTQLDSNGSALPEKSTDYAIKPWQCVKDNVTGLIWEVKTTHGLQNSNYTYTWYNITGVNDGGDHGIGDLGIQQTTGYEYLNMNVYSGSDNCENSARCDTEKYVSDVNAINLCGASDWYLPDRYELNSILSNYNLNFLFDESYFPNTQREHYWLSSPVITGYGAGYVDFGFPAEYDFNNHKFEKKHIRLVRKSF